MNCEACGRKRGLSARGKPWGLCEDCARRVARRILSPEPTRPLRRPRWRAVAPALAAAATAVEQAGTATPEVLVAFAEAFASRDQRAEAVGHAALAIVHEAATDEVIGAGLAVVFAGAEHEDVRELQEFLNAS